MRGLFMDFLKVKFGMDEWRYLYDCVWTVLFQIPALLFLYLLFLEWKARGGDTSFTPSVAD